MKCNADEIFNLTKIQLEKYSVCRDSSISGEVCQGLKDLDSIPNNTSNFSLQNNGHTASGSHNTSYRVDITELFLEQSGSSTKRQIDEQ